MERRRNPFTPTFGIVPPHLAGRARLLDDMRNAFADGLGNPNLASVLVGTRGSGKTALLSCIADEAMQAGWVCANTVAAPGMLEDVIDDATRAAAEFLEPKVRRSLTGLSIGQVLSVEWEREAQGQPSWRTRMTALANALAAHDVGLLVTVDEVRADVDEMVRLASAYQLLVREGHKVALVMAGLPRQVSRLLSDQSVSFLRRARRHRLGRVGDTDVESALRKTIVGAGKMVDDGALAEMVAGSAGFPYLMQLVGWRAWDESGNAPAIEADHARRGIALAEQDLRDGVLETSYGELSAGDRAFLQAMLRDEDASRLTDVARRLGKGTNYASTYKARLLDQGVIRQRADGLLAFDLPFFREYVRDMG